MTGHSVSDWRSLNAAFSELGFHRRRIVTKLADLSRESVISFTILAFVKGSGANFGSQNDSINFNFTSDCGSSARIRIRAQFPPNLCGERKGDAATCHSENYSFDLGGADTGFSSVGRGRN